MEVGFYGNRWTTMDTIYIDSCGFHSLASELNSLGYGVASLLGNGVAVLDLALLVDGRPSSVGSSL